MITKEMQAVYAQQLKYIGAHYMGALEAKQNGIPIVYVTAGFPVELVRAFEPHLYIVYPENHAVLMTVKGQADKLVERAEAEGLNRMGCAYELINCGYLLNGHGKIEAKYLLDEKGHPLPKLPEPDIILATDNQCRLICEWFKYVSDISGNKPYKMINAGDRYDGSLEKSRVEYVKNQMEEVISFLEEQLGFKMDKDKLLEVAKRSQEANTYWQKYLDLGRLKPSPISAFDAFAHLALIVAERGNQTAVEYYKALYEAALSAADQGIFPVRQEKHRLLWDNIATWYNFRELQDLFTKNDIAIVGSNYLNAWRGDVDVSNYENYMETMAKAYSTIYTNMTIPERINYYEKMVEEFSINGMIFHKNLSCHTYSLQTDLIAKSLEKNFGEDFRTVIFEGCQGISGRFQTHAFKTGVSLHFIER